MWLRFNMISHSCYVQFAPSLVNTTKAQDPPFPAKVKLRSHPTQSHHGTPKGAPWATSRCDGKHIGKHTKYIFEIRCTNLRMFHLRNVQ